MSNMKKLDQPNKRSRKMITNTANKIQNRKARAPLFESTWVALFLLLREELMQAWAGGKAD